MIVQSHKTILACCTVLLSAKAKRQITDAQTAGELWEVCCCLPTIP